MPKRQSINKGYFGAKLYQTASKSPLGPVASTEASLSPKVSRRRRHWSLSHCEQSVLVIATLDNRFAELQYGQTDKSKKYAKDQEGLERTRRETGLKIVSAVMF